MVVAQKTGLARLNTTREVAKFCHELRWEDLPQDVVEKAKMFCLDYIGIGLAGAVLEPIRLLHRFVGKLGHTGNSVVMGTRVRTAPEYAAWVNGASARAWDLDDTHRGAIPTHLGQSIHATAFAASEMVATDFKQFVTAVVLGFEVCAKLAKAMQFGKGTNDTCQVNDLGTAMVAGKILGLDEGQLVDALGIAGTIASGSHEISDRGYWGRSNHYGWQAHTGILVALLAKEGHGGSPTVIEGPSGFLHSFSSVPDLGVFDKLGDPFEILGNGLKQYPTCRFTQPSLDMILETVNAYDIQPHQVKSVKITLPTPSFSTVGLPKDRLRNPQSLSDFRLSIYYQVAVAILRRRVFMDEFKPTLEVFDSAEVREMMKKIDCDADLNADAEFPQKYGATTTMELVDGRVFSKKIDYPKGDPEDPFSWDEIMKKCNDMYEYTSSQIVSRKRYDEILARTRAMENERDIGKFHELLLADLV